MPAEHGLPDRMRLDKWLWAARFYKTRSLATQAIEHGQVKLNGVRVKPSREVKPGDRLEVQLGELGWTMTVRALSTQRGPAPVVQALYEEDPASQARRRQQAGERKLTASPAAAIKGRAHQARPPADSPLYRRVRFPHFLPDSFRTARTNA